MTDTDTIEHDDQAGVDDTEKPEQGDQGDAGKGEAKPWTPPTEAEWRATQDKLKKANGQAAAHRKAAEEAARKGETETEAKAREAAEKAAQESEGRWKPRYVRQAAKAALAQAGLTGTPDRLLKLIDHDQVDVDDDGELTGLDEQIRTLKKEYPELFARRGSGSIDGSDRGGDGRPRNADEQRRLKMLRDAGLA